MSFFVVFVALAARASVAGGADASRASALATAGVEDPPPGAVGDGWDG